MVSLAKEIENTEIELSPHIRHINYKKHLLETNTQGIINKLSENQQILLDYVFYKHLDGKTCKSYGRYMLFMIAQEMEPLSISFKD